MSGSITTETVRHLVNFQKTGENGFFEAFWADAESYVEKYAASWLKKHLVANNHDVDHAALADVTQRVAWKILMLPKKSGRSGWYDVERFGWEADRLRGWLYRVIRNEAVEHCKLFHNLGKKGAAVTFGDLELNDGDPVESVLKPSPKVDFDAFELGEIVAECLATLSPEGQDLYRLLLVEDLSQHEVARRTGVSPATVCRQWRATKDALRVALEARGIDAEWVAQAA